jgi:hypothetical protein
MTLIKANIEIYKKDIKVLIRQMNLQLNGEYKILKDKIELSKEDTQISLRRKSI